MRRGRFITGKVSISPLFYVAGGVGLGGWVVSWQGEGTQAINSLIDLVFFCCG
jgi:hypothetical protein